MWESQEDGPKNTIGAGMACRVPPSQFRVNFQPSNDFEKGMGVAVIVDGVLCTTKDSAVALMGRRLDEMFGQWAEHVAKM